MIAMAVTEAQKRTRNKWDAKNMSVISCKLKRDVAEKFKNVAKSNSTTPNELIRSWIGDYLSHETTTEEDH